jgi:hypothetical protein
MINDKNNCKMTDLLNVDDLLNIDDAQALRELCS